MPHYGNNDYLVTLTRQSELQKRPVKRVVTVTSCTGESWDMKDEYQRRDFTLGQIYHYGQNDHQPRDGCSSVSVFDVIHLAEGEDYMVEGIGFSRIHEDTTESGEDISTFFSDGVWS